MFSDLPYRTLILPLCLFLQGEVFNVTLLYFTGWSIMSWCWPQRNIWEKSLLLTQDGWSNLHPNSSSSLIQPDSAKPRNTKRLSHCSTNMKNPMLGEYHEPSRKCILKSRSKTETHNTLPIVQTWIFITVGNYDFYIHSCDAQCQLVK